VDGKCRFSAISGEKSHGPALIVAGVCYLRYGTLQAISRKQHFIVPAQTQQAHVQRLSTPDNKGISTLYNLASKLQKQKSRSNPYMVIFNFIGYFMVVLCDLPHVQISQILPLCYAIPTSLLLNQDSGLVCFLLIFHSATS
jgi:hypothetical protein